MRRFHAAGGLISALAVSAALSAPASAATTTAPDTEAGTLHEAVFMLSVKPENPGGGEAKRVVLTCGPDGGTHPNAAAACASLRAVGGELANLPSVPDTFCTMEHAPVEVTGIGIWDGKLKGYQETFSNRCVAGVETDNVFNF